MDKKNRIMRFIKNPCKLIRPLAARGMFNWIQDRQYLRLVYWSEIGKKLNLDRPVTFNEKLQWLKLYDRNPEYSKYVDKYGVRAYISEMIGEKYLIPLLGVYDSVEKIDWESFPDEFVLKCTHGSHCNIICTNKNNLDIKDSNIKLTKWMKRSWFWLGREWVYANIKPRIVCEKYIGDLVGVPNDYKIMCFNGEPQIIQIHRKDNNFQPIIDFYDMNGNMLPFRKKGFANSDILDIDVESLKKMFELARKLSQGTLYLRTDFYLVSGEIYFGELTFFDSSGLIEFEPDESNIFLGKMLNLEDEKCKF